MGYRSQVRALIYGDPDKLQALITAHLLTATEHNVFEHFKESLTRYKMGRTVGEMVEAPEGSDKPTVWLTRETEVECLDLYGDDWKWYEGYPDIRAWSALMVEAIEMGLSTEFVRIGEEDSDVEMDANIEDDGDRFLGVTRSIYDDIPEEREALGLTG